MRFEKWHAGEVLKQFEDLAEANANDFMDQVALNAKARCPVDPVTFRTGTFKKADVSFTPRTGSNKGKLIQFHTDNRWTGRFPNQLKNTIRRVGRPGSGNVRVYYGDFKVYYGLMVEKLGYRDRAGRFHAPVHFLQAPWEAMKNIAARFIQNGK